MVSFTNELGSIFKSIRLNAAELPVLVENEKNFDPGGKSILGIGWKILYCNLNLTVEK